MRMQWMYSGSERFWLAPVVLGIALILVGVLLCVRPEWVLLIVAYLIGGVLIVSGTALVVSGWRMRRNVTYRRVDENWQVRPSPHDVEP